MMNLWNKYLKEYSKLCLRKLEIIGFTEKYEEPVKPKAKKEPKKGEVVSKKENEVVNATTNI